MIISSDESPITDKALVKDNIIKEINIIFKDKKDMIYDIYDKYYLIILDESKSKLIIEQYDSDPNVAPTTTTTLAPTTSVAPPIFSPIFSPIRFEPKIDPHLCSAEQETETEPDGKCFKSGKCVLTRSEKSCNDPKASFNVPKCMCKLDTPKEGSKVCWYGSSCDKKVECPKGTLSCNYREKVKTNQDPADSKFNICNLKSVNPMHAGKPEKFCWHKNIMPSPG